MDIVNCDYDAVTMLRLNALNAAYSLLSGQTTDAVVIRQEAIDLAMNQYNDAISEGMNVDRDRMVESHYTFFNVVVESYRRFDAALTEVTIGYAEAQEQARTLWNNCVRHSLERFHGPDGGDWRRRKETIRYANQTFMSMMDQARTTFARVTEAITRRRYQEERVAEATFRARITEATQTPGYGGNERLVNRDAELTAAYTHWRAGIEVANARYTRVIDTMNDIIHTLNTESLMVGA